MNGDIVIGGVYLPALLLLGLLALLLTWGVTRALGLAGGYRLLAYRPLADLAIFTLLLGLLVFLTQGRGAAA